MSTDESVNACEKQHVPVGVFISNQKGGWESKSAKMRLEWVLEAANYDAVTVAIVLDLSVKELHRLMDFHGITRTHIVQKVDSSGNAASR